MRGFRGVGWGRVGREGRLEAALLCKTTTEADRIGVAVRTGGWRGRLRGQGAASRAWSRWIGHDEQFALSRVSFKRCVCGIFASRDDGTRQSIAVASSRETYLKHCMAVLGQRGKEQEIVGRGLSYSFPQSLCRWGKTFATCCRFGKTRSILTMASHLGLSIGSEVMMEVFAIARAPQHVTLPQPMSSHINAPHIPSFTH